MSRHRRFGSTFGAAFLIAATCTGTGMMAMPVLIGIGGFYPGLCMALIVWLTMIATGYLLLEVTLGMPDGTNMVSMAERYLGPIGKYFIGIGFFILYYCLMIGYYSFGIPQTQHFINTLWNIDMSPFATMLCLFVFYAIIDILGIYVADRFNIFLNILCIVALALLMVFNSQEVSSTNLNRFDWTFMLLSAPILFAGFGYHNIIPTISTYLKRNVRRIKKAIIWGTVIPLLIYMGWTWVVVGSNSQGNLWGFFERGHLFSQDFQLKMATPWLAQLAIFFSLVSTGTSFVGMNLTFVDFLGDGFKISKDKRAGWTRVWLLLIGFLPPGIVVSFYPNIFSDFIGSFQGFGQIILYSILPIWLVWISRYQYNLGVQKLVPGGRIFLLILLVINFYIIVLQSIMTIPEGFF